MSSVLLQFIKDVLLRPDGTIKRGTSNKNFLQKSYPTEYTLLVSNTSFLDTKASPSERVYATLNNLTGAPKCPCGQTVRYWRKGQYNEFCSNACPPSVKANSDRRDSTMLKRYGTTHAIQVQRFKLAAAKTTRENNSSLKNPVIRDKFSKTMLERHGSVLPGSSPEVRLKINDTLRNTFSNPERKKEINLKKIATCRDKYDSDYYVLTDAFKEKSQRTSFKNYNCHNYQQRHLNPKIVTFRNNKVKYKRWLEVMHYKKELSLGEIGELLNLTQTTLWKDFQDLNLEAKIFYRSSKERQVESFISSLYKGSIRTRVRDVIRGELDIFLPALKLAIEFNGNYWHSYNHLETTKERNSSRTKTLQCKELGIRLLTITESEWVDGTKNIIWKSILGNLLGRKNIQVGARSTKPIRVVSKIARNFYSKNHLQGFCKADIHLALTDAVGNLLSCMSFTKTKESYELVRFCTQIGHHISGGASKLLSHFITRYKPSNIVTFADLRYSYGNLYEVLGFKVAGEVRPRYCYCDGLKLINRRVFQKASLKTRYPELIEKVEQLSEAEFVFSYTKFRRLWDCGKIKYKYK